MKDKSSEIARLAGAALDACNAAIEEAAPYLIETDLRPDIEGQLQKIRDAARQLLDLVEAEGETKLHSSNAQGWDFAPWLQEKSSMIMEGVDDAHRYFLMDPSTVSLPPDAPVTPKRWISDGLLFGLDVSQKGAHAIFAMTFNDEIEIKGP